ncbi:MAG: NfeD family protein [Cytophagales bacterium]
MDWAAVIGLILIGISLLIVELIFIPGTTIFGIVGFACLLFGIYMGYENFGTSTGTIILISTLLVSIAFVVFSLRSKSWDKFALKSSSVSRFNEEQKINLQVGQEGVSISYLRPSGKAEFGDLEYEVFAHDEFITSGTRIVIEKIDNRKIFVKPKT